MGLIQCFILLIIVVIFESGSVFATFYKNDTRNISARKDGVKYNWSAWSELTFCSRSCGIGITYKHRDCYKIGKDTRKVSSKLCNGQARRYKTCNTQPCQQPFIDFRDLQCSFFNGRDESGIFRIWRGVHLADKNRKCVLVCSSTHFTRQFSNKVIDGTFCDDSAVCVDGDCRYVGCDNVLNSNKIYDKCGVCNGNNNTCEHVTGRVRRRVEKGYTELLELPQGARNILVSEKPRSRVILAMKDREGIFFFSASPKTINITMASREVAGTTFTYIKNNQTGNVIEKIEAKGPINETVTIMGFSRQDTAVVALWYSYTNITHRENDPKESNRSVEPFYPWQTLLHQNILEFATPNKTVKTVSSKDLDLIKNSKNTDLHATGVKQNPRITEPSQSQLKNGSFMEIVASTISPIRKPIKRVSTIIDTQREKPVSENDIGKDISKQTKSLLDVTEQSDFNSGTSKPRIKILKKPKEHTFHHKSENKLAQTRKSLIKSKNPFTRKGSSKPFPKVKKNQRNLAKKKAPRKKQAKTKPTAQITEVRRGDNVTNSTNTLRPHQSSMSKQHKKETKRSNKNIKQSRISKVQGKDSRKSQKVSDVKRGDRKVKDREEEQQKGLRVPKSQSNRTSKAKAKSDRTFNIKGQPTFMGRSQESNKRQQQQLSAARSVAEDGKTVEKQELSIQVATKTQPESLDKYDFSKRQRKPGVIKFEWRGNRITPCSTTCQPGVSVTFFSCHRLSTNQQVDDIYCDSDDKPDISHHVCSRNSCPPRWVAGEWGSCSLTCGEGVQHRQVKCWQMLAVGFDSSVHDYLCPNDTKPVHVRKCKGILPCGPLWEFSEWGKCSVDCGYGWQERSVRCNGHRESDCTSRKPAEKQACIQKPCSNHWYNAAWSECSGRCGVKHRKIFCRDQAGHVVDEGQCDIDKKPLTVHICSHGKGRCSYAWVPQEWRRCSVECGDGNSTRKIVCGVYKDGQFKEEPDTYCQHLQRPPDSTICSANPCGPKWYTTEWGECSEPCGDDGIRMRDVKCYHGNQRSENCFIESQPVDTEKCPSRPCPSKNDDVCVDDERCNSLVTPKLCERPYYRQVCCRTCHRFGF